MKPWSQAKVSELKKIQGVCLDIDDTLTSHGTLTAEAYGMLWKLKQRGFLVVPITGRPAGWCDMIARFWPVDAVVGENGAFVMWMDRTGLKHTVRKMLLHPAIAKDAKAKRAALLTKIQSVFPHAVASSDQAYREYDLSIDLYEDVPHWSDADVEKLTQLARAEGAHAKLSSIHLNTWFGDYDKLSGFKAWLSAARVTVPFDAWIFAGDSPNDEPLFAGFKNSVGVANLGRFLDKIKNKPTWITRQESGSGFVEMGKKLLSARGAVKKKAKSKRTAR